MCRDGILFCVSTFMVLTVLTSVLVSYSSVFATRPTVPLVEESRVAFPEDEVASLDYGVASLDYAYGVASLDDGVTSMEDNGVASLKDYGVTSLKDDGVASLKDDGVASLGNDSTDERAVLPSLMARIKPVGEDWRPPKEYLLGLGEPWEPYLWDYSDDSEDGYLLRASQAYEESVVQACNNSRSSKNDDNSKLELVTPSGECKTDGCASELVLTPKKVVTPKRWDTPKRSRELEAL